MDIRLRACTVAILTLAWGSFSPLRGQGTPAPADGRLTIGALPAVGYDADEGWEYGVLAELYHYDAADPERYDWTFQFLAEATTQGRREFLVFYDAPAFRGSLWRVSASAFSQKQIALPFYGLGNTTPFDESLVTDENPDFYRYTRVRNEGMVTLQRSLAGTPLRVLVGGRVSRATLEAVPEDEGTTLLAGLLDSGSLDAGEGWYNSLRGGLVWDTRDRETGPRTGVWSELLVQHAADVLGSTSSFTRWTLTDRRYASLAPGLVLAHRVLLQGVEGSPPFHELTRVQSSFKEQEGLGGSKTLRGVLWNRYQGRGLFIWNAELRWEATGFRLLGQDFRLVPSVFVDSGRVWEASFRLDEVLSDLHHGYGGGLRVVMGPDFVVGVDLGTSRETGLQLYTGLGYLF